MYHVLLFIALFGVLHGQPLFNGITLEEFGAVDNLNVPLQPANRFNENQPLRTNDFQALQQTLAEDRQVVRMGQFYISQGTTGPGITLPSTQNLRQDAITTPIDDSRLLFGCTESAAFNISSNLLTTQAITLTYSIPGLATSRPGPNGLSNDDAVSLPVPLPAPNFTIVDHNIIGNAYHDIQYTALTPTITFEGSTVTRVFVDEEEAALFGRLPEGRKFKVETAFIDQNTNTIVEGPTWLIYVERSTSGIRFAFDPIFNQFVASGSFTGFLRIAAIQTTSIPTSNVVLPPAQVGDFWATALVQQTKPATPISMYMLWPRQWVQLVTPQIISQINAQNGVPTCDIVPDILPVLAKLDFDAADSLFRQIPFNQYGNTNNPFVTYFMMLMASKQALEIDNYQANVFPSPETTNPNAGAQENAFDTSRSIIPITAAVTFTDQKYSWRYVCLEGASDPLIIYPAYKSLESPHVPVAGFVHLDAIKGPLQAVIATNNTVTFQVPSPPSFFQDSFFPTTFNLSSAEKSRLLQLYRDASALDQTVTARDIVDAGPQLYNIALTVQCAVYLFEQINTSPASIRSATVRLIERVKETIAGFLLFRRASDDFIGDSLTGGIVTSRGIRTTTERGSFRADANNGVYSNHHSQYGFWIAAAAVVAEWDRKFNQTERLINQTLRFQVTVKDYVDVLWRDCRNPDREDPDLPFNRDGNPWEGHSTATGTLYTPLSEGREQASWALDFHSWMATREWARQILLDDILSTTATQGFDRLRTFAESNMGMTVTSTPLIYQDKNWIYPTPYDINITLGEVFDTATNSQTALPPGTPGCPVIVR